MYNRIARHILEQGGLLRFRLAKAVEAFDVRQAQETAMEMRKLSEGYRDLATKIVTSPEESIAISMSQALNICALACDWTHSVLNAAESDHYLSSIRAHQTLLKQDLAKLTHESSARSGLLDWVSQAVDIRVDTIQGILVGLERITMPVFYSESYDPFRGIRQQAIEQRGEADEAIASSGITTPTVKLMFSLEETPWSTPQIVRNSVQYDVSVKIEALNWPLHLPILEIDYISTLDRRSYSITPFQVRLDSGKGTYEEGGSLIVRDSQSISSRPSSLRVRARFRSEDGKESIDSMIVGYTELKFKCIGKDSFPVLSQYPTLDVEILNIVSDIQMSMPDIGTSALDDFIACIIYISKYAGMVQQSGYFKGRRVHEVKDFQSDMVRQLRMTPLGLEVQEGEVIAGGKLDIRYRNVIIELKVEDSVKDRSELKTRYVAQPTQYTSSLLPLSIACILDMTEKDNPPANVANNVSLESVDTHGFEGVGAKYPSKVVVFIIDGNLKSPSDYS